MLSADTTVKLSLLMYLLLSKVFTLCCIKRDRVSTDAHTPIRFSILCNWAEPPWPSTRSANRICSGIEQRSSVINIRLHNKNRRLIIFTWYAKEVWSATFDVPRLSDADCVNKVTAFHN